MSSPEENKALVRRFIEEVYNRGNLDVADELLAPDYVSRDELTGEEASREELKRAIAEQAAASSDFHFSVVEQIAEGDKVVTRNIGSGTHDLAEYMGLPPSNARITIENISISRVVEGRIVEERVVSDSSTLWQRRMDQERIERERFEQELLVARRIQHALLPNAVPELAGWEISPYYRPAREVGGDFYDFLRVQEGRVGLVIGDVSGKGARQPCSWRARRAFCAPSPRAGVLSPARCWRRPTRSFVPTYRPTCSAPASTPSSIPRAGT